MKRVRVIAGFVIGVLLGATFVVSFLQSSPVDVAREYCSGKGVLAQDLAVLGYRGSSGLFANRQTVEFQVKGAKPAKRLVVELHQPVYFLPWQPVEFREEEQP